MTDESRCGDYLTSEEKGVMDLIQALEKLVPHDHLCLIYESLEEQMAAAIPFIRIGLERGDKCIYIADENTVESVMAAMREQGIDVDVQTASGALSVQTKQDSYLKQGSFDPDWMINFLTEATGEAVKDGFKALRVTGEMTWILGGEPGVERLIEYEAKLNYFLPKHDCLVICQYNRHRFPARTLIDVIHTHPLVIYGTMVCRNFYFVPPEEFLKQEAQDGSMELERLLAGLLERERIDSALIESEMRYRRIVETAVEGIWVLDAQACTSYVNQQMAVILGYEQEEMLGWPMFDFMDDEARNVAKRLFERRKKGVAEHHEFRFMSKEGRDVWTYISTNPLFSDSGEFMGALGMITDITERKRFEEELEKSESLLRTVLRNTPITIFATDGQGIFTLSEGKALETVGLKSGENVGVSAFDLFGSLPFNEETGEEITGEVLINRALAGRSMTLLSELQGGIFENQIGPLRDKNGGIIGIIGVAKTSLSEKSRSTS